MVCDCNYGDGTHHCECPVGLANERDQLAAQVAALIAELDAQSDADAAEWAIDAEKEKADRRGNLPSAAARYLAADKVAQALVDSMRDEEWRLILGTHLPIDAEDALAEWRKAAGR